MDFFLFGYGSLMNVRSASRALGRSVAVTRLDVVDLLEHRRTWSAKDLIYSERLGREVSAVFLDLQTSPGQSLNGILLPIEEGDLRQLDLREKNYERIDVTEHIVMKGGGRPNRAVFSFMSKRSCRTTGDEVELYVLQNYVEMVTAACRRLGPSFFREYQRTTEAIQFDLLGGGYTFVDRAQAKYV